jgi:hypothetical protein
MRKITAGEFMSLDPMGGGLPLSATERTRHRRPARTAGIAALCHHQSTQECQARVPLLLNP